MLLPSLIDQSSMFIYWFRLRYYFIHKVLIYVSTKWYNLLSHFYSDILYKLYLRVLLHIWAITVLHSCSMNLWSPWHWIDKQSFVLHFVLHFRPWKNATKENPKISLLNQYYNIHTNSYSYLKFVKFAWFVCWLVCVIYRWLTKIAFITK